MREHGRVLACIKEFEESSGIKIDTWRADNNKRIGEAVKLVLSGGVKGERDRLRSIADQLEYSLASIRRSLSD